jgi:5-formyltetrahydrofolate cyclo-ligase
LPSIALNQIDLVIVPGRVFDLHGHRLGRGAGYYDRFFGVSDVRATAAALAFDCQVLEQVPREPHDHPMNLIVTETRIIRPSSPARDDRQ